MYVYIVCICIYVYICMYLCVNIHTSVILRTDLGTTATATMLNKFAVIVACVSALQPLEAQQLRETPQNIAFDFPDLITNMQVTMRRSSARSFQISKQRQNSKCAKPYNGTYI